MNRFAIHTVQRMLAMVLSIIGCITVTAATPVASITVGSDAPVVYDDFDAAWSYAMSQQSATITLLDDITRTAMLLYQPASADARHTLDLNNHTITSTGTEDRCLYINKADAILTITDNSSEKGGLITMSRSSDASIYTAYVYAGELLMTGGRIYCYNDWDDEEWHPACAVYTATNDDAKLTMTGGTLEAEGLSCIYPAYLCGAADISGGTIIATATGVGNATAINVINHTTTIHGTAHLIANASVTAKGASVGAWISADGSSIQNGILNIEGGTIEATAHEKSALGILSYAMALNVGGTTYNANGTANISGGTITVKCAAPTATQVFAVQCTGSRVFDDATPHHLIGEARGVANISGGTFLVDTRDAEGKYVVNGNNIDLLRSWGTLNVTGGHFTIYQNANATGIGVYRGKTTVSGNPVFDVHCASGARSLIAGPWNHSDYCDADPANNLAEIEVNSGTFIAQSDTAKSAVTLSVWAYGALSAASETGDAGYAMSAKITVNGGEFFAIHATAGYARSIRQDKPRTGIYGTADAQVIIHAGKFKSLAGTYAENTPEGRIVEPQAILTSVHGGFYNTYSQLAPHIDDSCRISRLSSADPEYAEGYRYKVEKGPYVVRVASDEPDRQFASLTRAFNFAQLHSNPTMTLIGDVDFIGEALTYTPTLANAKCTLDMNGHTAMMNDMTSTFLFISKPDAVFTFKDSGTGGVFGMTQSSTYAITVWARQGKMVLESGKIFCDNTNTTLSGTGVRVDANTANDVRFEMTGGTIEAHSMYYSYALLARSQSDAISYATIKGGEIHAYSEGSGAFGITSAVGGVVTIEDNPKIIAEHTVTAISIRTETTGKLIVKGGRFSSNAGRIVAGTDIAITGGYYTERAGSYYRGLVEDYCVPPYHTFPTTAAEQATYGAEYKWKVEPLPESGSHFDIIDVDNTNGTLTLNVSDWANAGWPYTINRTAYPKTQRTSLRTMTIPYKGNPGDKFYILNKNKNGDIAGHRCYIIPEEITSATVLNADVAKPLFVKGTSLTVNANLTAKNIYVGPDATLTINSGRTLTADTIFLRTDITGAAQLIKNGSIAGSTKVVYTRIATSSSGYFPFGLPLPCALPVKDIRLSNNTDPKYASASGWILRRYDEQRRAQQGPSKEGANWSTLSETATIDAGKGYEMYSGVNYYREFYFPVDISALSTSVPVAYTSVSVPDAKQAGWNVLVSPLTRNYTNSVVPEGLAVSWMANDGTFEQEIPATIPPATVFAYQASQAGSLSFAGSSIAAAMPRRIAATEEPEQIQWILLHIRDEKGLGDQTSIYSHPTRYEQTYKTGIDVAKQSLTASRALIYSSHAYGEMAFAGIADSVLENGVSLVLFSPDEQTLTFSLEENEWLDRMEHVWLIDRENSMRTDLTKTDYTFDAAAGTTTGRFSIEGQFRTPAISTDIESVAASAEHAEKAHKIIIDNTMYIIANGQLYDAMGHLINSTYRAAAQNK